MSEQFLPTSEIAAVAWLRSVPGLPPAPFIDADELPGDSTLWADTGFIQVGIAGGTPNVHLPQGDPVLDVTCWAIQPDSQHIPWGQARNLAALIDKATRNQDLFIGAKATPPEYREVRVLSAHLISEPRPVTDDPQRAGGYQFDLQMHWAITG